MSRRKAVEYLRISKPNRNEDDKSGVRVEVPENLKWLKDVLDKVEVEELKNQVKKNREFAEEKNLNIVESFADTYVSGAVDLWDRDGFLQCFQYTQDNNIKLIVTYSLDRLTRGDAIQGLNNLRDLTDKGYIVHFSSEPFLNEIEDPMLRKKMLMDMAWFSEYYREDIKKKSIEGIERARAEGKKIGRPETKINWRKVKQYKEMNLSWSAISKLVGVPYSTFMRHKRYKEKFGELQEIKGD